MPPNRRQVLAAIGTSLALAGCTGGGDGGGGDGNGDGNGDGGATATPTATDTAGMDTTTTGGMDGPTVQVRSHPDLGEHLVGPDGTTLYMFDQDTEGDLSSTCTGGCASAWPPLTVSGNSVTGGDGVTATLALFERGSGEMQATAGGWPLYYYAEDGEPGDVKGQGVGGVWWVLRPDGTPVREGQETTTTEGSGETTTTAEDPY